MHKRLISAIAITTLLVGVGLVAFTGNKAFAATFYNTDQSKDCDKGSLKLNPPYTDADHEKSFWCVKDLQNGEGTPAPAGGCPAGTAGFNLFGPGCLTNIKDLKVIKDSSSLGKLNVPQPKTNSGKRCGSGDASIVPSIDLGCRGQGNGILDLLFALVRLLSAGVGLIIVGSLIVAGIQYTSSRGDPQATANAVKRISNTVLALVIYIFAFALLGWIIPGAVLK